ncbi:hypothetical protein JCM21714_4178 [Gracilibacillus boraciitolerans JCM 21714]|uniref:Uncharacterized protein n=1 Tax=Gracilibacillus boraciitolerans JCM 21714 TaxID=1298598 RepID=W4VP50_9BACI|nr:hypothetical protein [Gracilibacillus boraciitolerans]GAE94977.1 hypothetical protein JCM21714_4178 [Gracilibacillus boraciitolerans JCM 21714]
MKQKDITLARDFYQLALFFEKTTYGEQQISEEDFNQYQNNIEQWMKAIAQTYQSHTEIGER